MKTTEEMIAVMQAYADGKKIEHKTIFNADWEDAECPVWNWGVIDYRIKPEPKYRPYANADECFADVKKHGGWVKCGVAYYNIVKVGDAGVYFFSEGGIDFDNFGEFMRFNVWADDGTPCGVLEEE